MRPARCRHGALWARRESLGGRGHPGDLLILCSGFPASSFPTTLGISARSNGGCYFLVIAGDTLHI